MRNKFWYCCTLVLFLRPHLAAQAPQAFTWEQVRDRFELNNPTLLAGTLNIEESKTQEITANLRPNPYLTILADQIDPFNSGPAHGPFAYFLASANLTYLWERQHKRGLRLESAQKGTAIVASGQADLVRTLLFNLRGAFVDTLHGKAVLELAKTNLDYYDRVLNVSREQFKAGDIAQLDLDRLDLQRVQFESDLRNAEVALRTAKIQLLQLLNDRTPVDQFDVTGVYDFPDSLEPLEDFRKMALDTRPDLRATLQTVDKAETDHKLAEANGSTDPTLGFDFGRNPPIDAYIGFSVTVPLRVFDRNQGEKLRTQIEMHRTERLRDAMQAEVLSDVDSAYATLNSTLNLLHSYKQKYLEQAIRIRDTVYFSYRHGGASLLEFMNAEAEYRSVQLNYLDLVGSYLTGAGQMNLAVGREAIQ